MIPDKEGTNNRYQSNVNREARLLFLSGTMNNRVVKLIWIILPTVFVFLISCVSSQQKKGRPTDARFYNNRGIAYGEKGQYDQAISEFSKAIQINPNYDKAYNNRGIVYRLKGEYNQAISDFNKAIQINSLEAEGYNNLAWLYATAKSPVFRNGKKAVELGTKACELSVWRNAEYLDTLAAAYARAGDFDNAVKWQEKALQCVGESKKSEAQRRLNFYRSRKPWPED
ncbi:MAG TPA: tetratricopeptide repeat protein [Thermodesulfobacteriota bacterium]|nr:tetratricopeptide repeat protein [Thermodesulfobacteriota bacterium]